MPFTCCVPLCKTIGTKIFHSFPKDETTCRHWIAKTKCFHLCKKHTYEALYKTHYKVCRNHFRKEDVKISNRLRRGAIPCLNLPLNSEQSCLQDPINVPLINESNVQMKDVQYIDTQYIAEDVQVWDVEVFDVDIAEVEAVANESVEEGLADEDTGKLIELEISFVGDSDVEMVNVDGYDNVNTIEVEYGDSDIGGHIEEKHICVDEQNVGNQTSNDLQDSTNCQKARSYRKYSPTSRKMRYLIARNKFLSQKIKRLQKPNRNTIISDLKSILSPDQLNFVALQIKNAGKKSRGKRFTFEDKSMALAIYKQSPKCYRHLSETYDLPSKQTLNKHAAKIRFETGISHKLMDFIKNTVSELNDSEKKVMLLWDEMALSAHLDFAEIKDYIDGFEDLNEKRTNSFATHALVFMIRGIDSAFKQPIAYFLTESINAEELSELIKLVIEAVSDVGMYLNALMVPNFKTKRFHEILTSQNLNQF